MGGAEAAAGFGVEVFVEKERVAFVPAVAGSGAVGAGEEEGGEAFGQLVGDLGEVEASSRAGGEFGGEGVAVVGVVFAEGFDEEEVDRHPDRAAPVGVAAEEAGVGLARGVVDAVGVAVDFELEGLVEVAEGEGAEAEGAEEFVFVEDGGKKAFEAGAFEQGEEVNTLGVGGAPA